MNRLSRDEIIHRALNMIDSPSLDAKDRPGGALQQDALSLGWLQDAIDYITRRYPYGASITNAGSISLATGGNTGAVPTDYILGLKDGLYITTPTNKRRQLKLKSYNVVAQRLFWNDTATGTPSIYSIRGTSIRFDILADQDYTLKLHYYVLPAVLDADDIPAFPDDYALVEYVRIRGQEWMQQAPQGSALAYASTIVAALRQSGIGQEAEDDSFTLDPSIYRPQGNEPTTGAEWLGDSVPR